MQHKRLFAASTLALVAVAVGPRPAGAHSGADHAGVTSDYRTRIVEVSPTGLDVELVDIDGTLRLTWTGPGELIVIGYENEQYLRIDSSGTYQNTRSPAVYLNEDRFANVDIPATADVTAAPVWERLSNGSTVEWHDHRDHWMSAGPPPEAGNAPNEPYVVHQRWEVPILVDGVAGFIAGDHVWFPRPSSTPFLLAAITIGVVALTTLWSRWWRGAAIVIAGAGVAAITVDTSGYVGRSTASLSNRASDFIYPALAVWALGWLVIQARRRSPNPTLAMVTAGLIMLLIGGVSRSSVLSRSHVFSTLSPSLSRWCVSVCLAVGGALTIRFLVFLATLLATPAARAGDAPR
jgi:hypothetical protein